MVHAGISERRETGGFTLLELIVTLIILTVVLGAVSPVFIYSLRSNRHEQALRDFVAYLKYAQENAIARTQEYRVYLNPEARTYWVMNFSPRKDGSLELVPAAEPFAGVRRFPSDVKIDDPEARRDKAREAYFIAFYPNGASDFATVKLRYGRHGRFEIKTKGNLGVFATKEKEDQ